MSEKLSLRTNANCDIYVYIEDPSGASLAFGADSANGVVALNTSGMPNTEPLQSTANLTVDPTANGDILFRPHGSGKSEFNTGDVQVTAGDVTVIAGNVVIPSSNAGLSQGAVFQNADRLLHTYGTASLYCGIDAGNGTLNPVTSINNSAFGSYCMQSITTGAQNNAGCGVNSFYALLSGQFNTAIGTNSLDNLTTGYFNTAIGYGTGTLISTGSNNILVGERAGFVLGAASSSNIQIGNQGTGADNNVIRIGTTGAGAGQQNRAFMAGIHGITPAGASQQLMIMDSSGQMGSTAGGAFSTNSFATDSGTATPAAGVITIAGGLNITTSGAASTVTVNVGEIVGVTNSGASTVPYIATGTGQLGTVPGGAVLMNTGTQSLSISSDASATTVAIATGAAVKGLTLGSTNSTSASTLQSGSGALNVTSTNGALTINSGTGALSISNDASATTLTIGTGGAVKGVTLGSTNSTSATTVQSGSGALAITSTNGTLTANSGTGALSISSDASATTVNIATGAAAKTVSLGSTNSTSLLALKYGTADFTLASATGTVMSALDTGEITYPLQPAFLAYLGSTVSNVTGNGGLFTLGTTTALTEVFDQNGDFNTNGTFTAPVTGRYHINGGSLIIGATIASTFNLRFISSNRNYLFQLARVAGANNFGLNGSALVDMDASDTVTVQIEVAGEAGNTNDVYGDTFPVSFISGYLAC